MERTGSLSLEELAGRQQHTSPGSWLCPHVGCPWRWPPFHRCRQIVSHMKLSASSDLFIFLYNYWKLYYNPYLWCRSRIIFAVDFLGGVLILDLICECVTHSLKHSKILQGNLDFIERSSTAIPSVKGERNSLLN